jgi:hypothetical protein
MSGARMTFQIPKSERNHLAALVNASPELLDAVKSALANCLPHMLEADFSAALTKHMGSMDDKDRSALPSISRTLRALYQVERLRKELSALDAAEEIVSAVKSDGKFEAPRDGWDRFLSQLASLLDDRVLGISSKAALVSTQTPRHIHHARVLTDARPIFSDNVADGPVAFTIIHTLQIEYFEDGQDREWFIALDGDDLESLQGAAERAIAKEQTLRASLKQLNRPILSWKEDDVG